MLKSKLLRFKIKKKLENLRASSLFQKGHFIISFKLK